MAASSADAMQVDSDAKESSCNYVLPSAMRCDLERAADASSDSENISAGSSSEYEQAGPSKTHRRGASDEQDDEAVQEGQEAIEGDFESVAFSLCAPRLTQTLQSTSHLHQRRARNHRPGRAQQNMGDYRPRGSRRRSRPRHRLPRRAAQGHGHRQAQGRCTCRRHQCGKWLLAHPTQRRPRRTQPALSQQVKSLLGDAVSANVDRDLEREISILQEVIKIEPKHAQAWDMLSDAYQELNDPDGALLFKIMAAHLRHDPDVWMDLGIKSKCVVKCGPAHIH